MRKIKSFSKLTNAKNLLKDLKIVNHMSNAKKLKVKKARAKKEIIKHKVEYPSLSENYEEDLIRSIGNLNPDNELMNCEYLDKQYKLDMRLLTAIIAILLVFIVLLTFPVLILIFK